MTRARKTVGLSKADRILRALEQDIVSGKIANGDRLDSENRLMRRFSVSRNTIRKGLDELARQGLITKRSGVGSFATYDGKVLDESLGWTQALTLDHEELAPQLASIRRGPCSRTREFLRNTNASFNAHSDDYLRVDRITHDSVLGVGLSLERRRLPWRDEYQQVLDQGLTDDSLSATLASLDIIVVSGKEWAGVLPGLSDRDAELMHRKAGVPMLQLQRVTYNAHGELIEYIESILDPARFALHLNF